MGRRAALAGVLLAVSAIALVTLLPTPTRPLAAYDRLSWTLAFGAADALRNVVLFLPLGATLAWARLPLARALCVGVALSGLVELLQLFIPSRFASPFDVGANALGTAAGVLLVRGHRVWRSPSPTQRRALFAGAAVVAALGAIAPGVLFDPTTTGQRLFGHRSPRPFMGLFPYDGVVVRASVDGIELPNGAIRDPERLQSRLIGDHHLLLEVHAGSAPAGRAAFLGVYDEERKEVLTIGPDRSDLAYRFLTLGSRVGLEAGRVRLPGALRGVASGDPLRIRLDHVGSDICVEVNDLRTCGQGFTVGDGWMLVTPDARALSGARSLLQIAWLALLFLPLGYWTLGLGSVVAACLSSSIALGLAPSLLPLLDTPTPQLLAPVVGLAAGRIAARVGYSP